MLLPVQGNLMFRDSKRSVQRRHRRLEGLLCGTTRAYMLLRLSRFTSERPHAEGGDAAAAACMCACLGVMLWEEVYTCSLCCLNQEQVQHAPAATMQVRMHGYVPMSPAQHARLSGASEANREHTRSVTAATCNLNRSSKRFAAAMNGPSLLLASERFQAVHGQHVQLPPFTAATACCSCCSCRCC